MSSLADLRSLLETSFPLHRNFPLETRDIIFSRDLSSSAIKVDTVPVSTSLRTFCDSTNENTPSRKEKCKDQISFRWYHAPANHVGWVEAVSSKLQDLVEHKYFSKFWSLNELSNRRGNKNALFMRSTSDVYYSATENNTKACTDLEVFIIPYIDWAELSVLSSRQKAIDFLLSDDISDELRRHYYSASEEPDIRLTSASFVAKRPLHLSRSLDQYQYPNLNLSFSRIADQVVPQHTKNNKQGVKALVVNQLWLVTMPDGVSSFFPGTLTSRTSDISKDPTLADLEDKISLRISKITSPDDVCSDLHDLVALMVDECVRILVDSGSRQDLQILDCYRDTTALLRQNCINSLASFKSENDANDNTISTSEADNELSMVLRTSEIINELQILRDIVQEQRRIIEVFCSRTWGPKWMQDPATGSRILKSTEQKLQELSSEFDKLESNCNGIKSDLLYLLDLRQKRASLQEAHAAVQQAAQTSEQTKLSLHLSMISSRQSRAMVIFTIMTVLFLPLSFFTSFFALDISQLQPLTMIRFWAFAGPISLFVIGMACVAAFAKMPERWRKRSRRNELDKIGKMV